MTQRHLGLTGSLSPSSITVYSRHVSFFSEYFHGQPFTVQL